MQSPLSCPRCSFPNQHTNVFCAQCGAQLPARPPQQGLTSGVKALLIVLGVVGFSVIAMVAVAVTLQPPPTSKSTATPSLTSAPPPVSAPPDPKTGGAAFASQVQEAKRLLASGGEGDLEKATELLNSVPATAKEFKEAVGLMKKAQDRSAKLRAKREAAEAPAQRERLLQEYETLVATANPHLNYIGSKITKAKGGYAIWATHEFFTQYSFSAGEDARIVSRWINERDSELRKAGIVRVGVMGKGEFASWSYFDLK